MLDIYNWSVIYLTHSSLGVESQGLPCRRTQEHRSQFSIHWFLGYLLGNGNI